MWRLYRWVAGALAALALLGGCRSSGSTPSATTAPTSNQVELPEPNLDHLIHLSERIELKGQEVLAIWIYAEAPDYEPAPAVNEGFTCVDDTARFVVAASLTAERTGAAEIDDMVRGALELVMAMQADDGRFFNFLREDGTINQSGPTSYPDHGWWASRAIWALGTGARHFAESDPELVERLRTSASKLMPYYDQELDDYGQTHEENALEVPDWLIKDASDVTSEAVLGLLELYRHQPDEAMRARIAKLCDGMTFLQIRDDRVFMYGAHPSNTTTPWRWHHWGSRQTMALARAARILSDHPHSQEWLDSARLEADVFFTRLLQLHIPEVVYGDEIVPYPQIAYGVNSIVLGALELYRTTGEDRYLSMSLEAASWYTGSNTARARMYDETTGRCFDGIRGPNDVNRNSGAESTIEAVLALEELTRELAGE